MNRTLISFLCYHSIILIDGRCVKMDIHTLSKRFNVFADRECRDSSDLYHHLALHIAEDHSFLQLASHARPGQPVPNLLFGAVHYLLLKGLQHPLLNYYSSIVSKPMDPSTAIDALKDFCNRHEDEIIQLLTRKIVQTNEVRRCGYLYPSFCYIYQLTQKPLALVEIGTSAGLQLLWDKYAYRYNSNQIYGDKQSELKIAAEIRGDTTPFLTDQSPPVANRIGIDLHINDVMNPEDYLWLKALIWPEHHERRVHFERAALLVKQHPLELIEGDGVALLPSVASNIPKESTLCVFHTHVANQIPHEAKLLLMKQIQDLGQERDIFHLYNNMWDLDLHLDYHINGQQYKRTLAKTDGHGRWFEWIL